jgi:hypothetical protein
MQAQARAHSGTKRSRKYVKRDKPKNGPVTESWVDPRAIRLAQRIVKSPRNSYTSWAIESGQVIVR